MNKVDPLHVRRAEFSTSCRRAEHRLREIQESSACRDSDMTGSLYELRDDVFDVTVSRDGKPFLKCIKRS